MILELKNGSTFTDVVFVGARGKIIVHPGCSVRHVMNGDIEQR